MIRALVDANVLISYLMAGSPDTAPVVVMSSGFSGTYKILMSPSLMIEVFASVMMKPALAARISRAELSGLLQLLLRHAEFIDELEMTPAPFSRDPKDDYLLAHAVLERADYIVSGDRHLLELGHIATVSIVSTAEFARILAGLPVDEDEITGRGRP